MPLRPRPPSVHLHLFKPTFLLPSLRSQLSTTRPILALSESDHDQDDGTRSAEIEHLKQDTVSKAKSGKGEWKPELASSSEQNVKADRDGEGKSIEDLQREGARKAQEGKQPAGSSSNTGG